MDPTNNGKLFKACRYHNNSSETTYAVAIEKSIFYVGTKALKTFMKNVQEQEIQT